MPRNKVNDRRIVRDYQENLKVEVLALYSPKCNWCGYSENLAALQIDHINDNAVELGHRSYDKMGVAKRKVSRPELYKYVLKNPGEFQILCANCNAIKERNRRREKQARIDNVGG